MLKINDLVGAVFSGLSDLVIEDVVDENDLIRVMARTRDEPVPCLVCGVLTGRVHGFCGRTVTDVPIDGRTVVVSVTVRRLVCPALGRPRQTFREQVPGLLERYQRRTNRLTGQLGAVVRELAGRAGARLSQALNVAVSRSTGLRLLMRLPLPPPRVPRVLGVDDFALKRRHRYATILIDAETGERIDVLPGRGADALEAWLRAHPAVEIVCRDGSGAYGEAVRKPFKHGDLVAQGKDLGVLVSISHRQQPQRGEGVRDGEGARWITLPHSILSPGGRSSCPTGEVLQGHDLGG